MSKLLRVLMVEDSDGDVQLMIRTLKKAGYEPAYQQVETAESMRNALEKEPWDVILCDYQMPQFTGQDAIALLKETGMETPLIIVSGIIGEETAVECMRSGALDYIMKGNLARLIPAIERELREAAIKKENQVMTVLLGESEKRFTHVFQHAPVPMAIASVAGGQLLAVNKKYVHLTGFSQEELRNHTVKELNLWVNPDEREEIIRTIRQTKTVSNRPIMVRTKSGGILDLLFSADVMDIEGITCMVSSAIDITEQKRHESKIRELSQMNQRVLDSAGEGIYGLDFNSNVTFMNVAGARMLGWDVKEIIGMNSHKAWHHTRADGTFYPEEECGIKEILKNGVGKTSIEDWFWKKDGRGFPVEYTNNPIYEKDLLIGAVVTFRDITERKQATEKLKKALEATVQTIAMVVETRDPYTAGHQRRVADLAEAIAMDMAFSSNAIDGLKLASSIHDIGKISVPAEILSKPAELSVIEFSLIKEHAAKGYLLLKDVESPWPLAEIVHQHHERMDGSGYPRNLKGEEICIEARILAVADIVEAMASHRPYRPGLGIENALSEIEKNSGILYDNNVAYACLRLFREKGFRLNSAEFTQ